MKTFVIISSTFLILYGILSLIRIQEDKEENLGYPKRWIIIWALMNFLLGIYALIHLFINQWSEYD